MPTGQRKDPYLSHRFRIEIDGIISAGFSEASGLQADIQTEDIREGGLNEYPHKIIKGTSYQAITLKRGLTTTEDLWQWHRDVINGKVRRKSISIILMDDLGEEKWRWNFRDAFPTKWNGPDLKADGNTVAIESLEIVHHGFTKV